MARGDGIGVRKVSAEQHFTEPPPRYSEASIIKKLEELGIGRPSTYVSVLSTIRDRGYARLDKKRFIPEDKGRVVTAFLESFFSKYVEYDFTANLEEQLDRISNGEIDWREVLREFWKDFSAHVGEIKDLRVTHVLDALNEILAPHIFPSPTDGSSPRKCPSCADGQLSLKLGKFGSFVGCSNYPDCKYTRQMTANGEGESAIPPEGIELGVHPDTGEKVTRRQGRFGPYLQLGEVPEGSKEKPKRASIPRAFDPNDIDLETALKFLSLPREIGLHPETQTPIVANFGRFGPFILHDGTYVNLESAEEVFTIGINRAVDMLAAKRAKGFTPRGRAAALKDLGAHPDGTGTVQVFNGKFGAYVKHGKVNATLPRDTTPETVTLEQAVALIAEREAKGPGKKPKRRVAAKKTPALKVVAEKTPAKKPAKKAAKKAVKKAAVKVAV